MAKIIDALSGPRIGPKVVASDKACTHEQTPADVVFAWMFLFLVVSLQVHRTDGVGCIRQPTEYIPLMRPGDAGDRSRSSSRLTNVLDAEGLVLRLFRRLGTKVGAGDCCRVFTSFSGQFGIVQAASVAQGASTIGPSAPFRCLGPVTAVTSTRRSSTLFRQSVAS